jgi:hypothetical protein
MAKRISDGYFRSLDARSGSEDDDLFYPEMTRRRSIPRPGFAPIVLQPPTLITPPPGRVISCAYRASTNHLTNRLTF